MNRSDPSSHDRESTHSVPKGELPIESGQEVVPAFGCIVYFSTDTGGVKGRVANLAGIEITASNQREMLGQIVARFKSAVSTSLASGEQPDWIDPPSQKLEHETKLFLPVHL